MFSFHLCLCLSLHVFLQSIDLHTFLPRVSLILSSPTQTIGAGLQVLIVPFVSFPWLARIVNTASQHRHARLLRLPRVPSPMLTRRRSQPGEAIYQQHHSASRLPG